MVVFFFELAGGRTVRGVVLLKVFIVRFCVLFIFIVCFGFGRFWVRACSFF